MMRRLLGPIGGPIVFFLVAALVFAGLGWVTYSALRVEKAQREAAARAELGNNLRIALWQLDSRMLPALGVEDSRPYYHYAPPDPAATPLFVANLPVWMKLHFQLDPATGWNSPLVLDQTTADFVREAWADVPPRNMSPERAVVLADLKARYPCRSTHDLFAVTDRSIPSDSFSLAAPIVSGDTQQDLPPAAQVPMPPAESPAKPSPMQSPEPVSNGVPASEPTGPGKGEYRILGMELCLRDGPEQHPRQELTQNTSQKKVAEPTQQPSGNPRGMSQQPASGRGGRLSQKDVQDNEKQVTDWLSRAGLIDRAIKEAKNAAEFQMPKNQLGNYGQNFDLRNSGNTTPGVKGGVGQPAIPTTSPAPGGIPAGPLPPGGGPPPLPPVPPGGGGFKSGDKLKEGKEQPGKPSDEKTLGRDGSEEEKARLFKKLEALDGALLAYELSERCVRPSDKRLAESLDVLGKLRLERAKLLKSEAKGGNAEKLPTPVNPPPGEERPMPPAFPLPVVQPHAIHLGSMRPQWITAPDGSELLVLVRSAKVDDKVVYQGVVVDWPKLEEELMKEVRPIFPDAKLVPVKDTSAVYADRAMTALPIQLDPGPEPELAAAGWTPLRIGLVLAWLAAIIAFTAVGFAGWSLIDLAERRIRFVSAVTHELRTPLTSLRLYLDLLVSGMIQDEKKRQEYLGTLAIESDRLHRLIDNVLDFAKLEKRKKNGDIKPVKVSDLVEQLRQTWTDRLAQDDRELVVVTTLPADIEVNTDGAMIQQIVGNLIDNARKYSRDAEDRRIWLWAKPGSGSSIVLEVEDRGAGVPMSERKSIFKPFRRGEQADARAGGAGLGLALAKSWAEVLGATLTYRTPDGGAGACFRLELPRK